VGIHHHAARAEHIDYDHLRVARNVLRHVPLQQAGVPLSYIYLLRPRHADWRGFRMARREKQRRKRDVVPHCVEKTDGPDGHSLPRVTQSRTP
jgi:hypothetical protein